MTWQTIAIPLVQGFEQCRLVAYHGEADPPGLYTCGWGSTGPDVTAKTVWTQAQADARFLSDLNKFAAAVDALVKVPLTDHQKAALVSFAYNEGDHALAGSTLLRMLNNRDYHGAAMQFLLWNKANGVVVNGLKNRRLKEQTVFNTPDAQP